VYSIRNFYGPGVLAGHDGASEISFGFALPSAPVVHVIHIGAAVPAGCSGSASAPGASPGHLCIFEGTNTNADVNLFACNPVTGLCDNSATPYGTGVSAEADGYGAWSDAGTWAVTAP
jgi:hypothetical protein